MSAVTLINKNSRIELNTRAELLLTRNDLKTQQAAIESSFVQHKNPALLLKHQTQLIDRLLKAVWLKANIHKGIGLVAVGGYGRREMFPYSDIDLLILLPEQLSESENQKIVVLIGLLWDIGLNVGHSVRTLAECTIEANNDVTVQTNLLESRYLIGNKTQYNAFLSAITAM